MNRNDFVNRLFNNGNGLTLDQIEKLERDCTREYQYIPAAELRLSKIELMKTASDLLDLRDLLRNTFELRDVTDNQVYALSYAICNFIH